jgi:hypothetical protein
MPRVSFSSTVPGISGPFESRRGWCSEQSEDSGNAIESSCACSRQTCEDGLYLDHTPSDQAPGEDEFELWTWGAFAEAEDQTLRYRF